MQLSEIEEIIAEIKNYISSDSLSRATLRLMDVCRDVPDNKEIEKDALLIRAEYSSIQKGYVRLGYSESLVRRKNDLNIKILFLLDVIKEHCLFYVTNNESIDNPKEEIDITTIDKQDTQLHQVQKLNPTDFVNKEKSENLPVIQIQELKQEYNDFALSISSLSLCEGEILGIVGKNGSGKSTLLRIISSIEEPTKGQLKYNLGNPANENYNSKEHIFYLPQDIKYRSSIKVKKYLNYCFAKNGILGNDNKALVERVIHRFRLEDHANKAWNELSGGYKLRLELARAYGIRPKLLVLDEPLGNLDVLALSKILRDIKDFSKSIYSRSTIVLSSQHLFEVEQISDKLMYLQDGQCLFYGYKSDLEENGFRYYNFICDLNSEDVNGIISNLCDSFSLENDGVQYELIISSETDVKSIFSRISEKSNEFEYFIDFTRSLKRLFITNNEK